MSDFSCPKCKAKVTNQQDVGCPACGFGKHKPHNEHAPQSSAPKVTEAPRGFTGNLLTEDL